MTLNQARLDALATARVRLADEERAIEICRAHGSLTDMRFAQRERDHYAALVTRLLAKGDAK